MISVAEARQHYLQAVARCASETLPLGECAGKILAEDVRAPLALPPFSNSAMDGYALRREDTLEATADNPVRLRCSEVIAAGATHLPVVEPGVAVQILTGAPVPPGADAVIRQEDVESGEGHITIRRAVRQGENIRRAGEEIAVGDVPLRAGMRVTPGAVALAANLGLYQLRVSKAPRVAIIVTGNETVRVGERLNAGQIYDSNSHTLTAALMGVGINPSLVVHCSDDEAVLRQSFDHALDAEDVLLVTGGVSVGKFDFVKAVAESAGLEQAFWRVKQKPGKPLLLAQDEARGKTLFGLPGNPASVLVCFYEYVLPALWAAMGADRPPLRTVHLPLLHDFNKAAGLTHFLRARTQPAGVEILQRQGSHMMSSFAEADALVILDEDCTGRSAGDLVEVHLLPT